MAEKVATFGQRLREGLDRQGITQTELARRSGISKSSISRYVKGDWEGKQEAVYALAQALEVNEAWLMGYDVPPARGTAREDLYRTVAQVVENYRERGGFSVEQAAEWLKISADELQALESGVQPMDSVLLARMAQLYGIPEEELNRAAANELLSDAPRPVRGTTVTFEGAPLSPAQIEELRQFARFLQGRDGNEK